MDSLDVLAREEEFRKLNRQLNKKTESLMKEIEDAMQKPDIFSDFSHSLIFKSDSAVKKHSCQPASLIPPTKLMKNEKAKIKTQNLPNKSRTESDVTSANGNNDTVFMNDNNRRSKGDNDKINDIKYLGEVRNDDDISINCDRGENGDDKDNFDDNHAATVANDTVNRNNDKDVVYYCCNERTDDSLEFLYAFVSVNVKTDILPKTFVKGNISVERVCKCLASKVKLLQEQIDKLQAVINKKTSLCESHMTRIADLESERMTLLNKTNNMKASTTDMRAKCLALQKRLEEKDRLYKEQRSEADKLSSEVKRLKARNASAEAKCASQEITIDTLKQQLEVARRAEKELKDSSRVVSASHESAISGLESQNKALKATIEKQMELIDNLRKQNAILNTEGALKALEQEYCTFLNQDFD